MRLERDKPAACHFTTMEISALDPAGYSGFSILPSDTTASGAAVLLPDLASCPACLEEMRDGGARHYRNPFVCCSRCGPRFTVLVEAPMERRNTTMAGFSLCPNCEAELANPASRRFKAEPISCAQCGPRLEYLPGEEGSDPLALAAALVQSGGILALKGLGGFQLFCDARDPEAVSRLRTRKREAKPLAVMFPNLEAIESCCRVSREERRLLTSTAAPIVLLEPEGKSPLAGHVCLGSPWIGAMLPHTPLDHLLMDRCRFPLVATSGNHNDEPIATENADAQERLSGIADAFLWHNRPIARPCDDSVVQVTGGAERVMRRSRGYAPLPILVRQPLKKVLAVGADRRSTVSVAMGRQVFLSPHIGDLSTEQGLAVFQKTVSDLCRLFHFEPDLVACDMHPDLRSSLHAESLGLPVTRVQHHMAHAAACAAENDIVPPYLGVVWDSSGYGVDGTLWGSEFFVVDERGFQRLAHFRPFLLPGGDSAVRDCRRTALSLLHDCALNPAFAGLPDGETAVLTHMLDRRLQSPVSTSAARLFDAVAVLTGVCSHNYFEGQTALALEAAVLGRDTDHYDCDLADGSTTELDWECLIHSIVKEVRRGLPAGDVVRRFHNTMAEAVAKVALRAGLERVVLSGDVFQNRYLVNRTQTCLAARRFRTYTHQRVPTNDGGLSLGQAVVAGSII